MASIDSLISKLDGFKENLQSLAATILEKYPNSQNLVRYTDDIKAALEGLTSLHDGLQEALVQARGEESQSQDLKLQLDESPVLGKLPKDQKARLVEYLIKTNKGVAKPEELVRFMSDTLFANSDEDLLEEVPKKQLLELGREQNPASDEFEAYNSGRELLKQRLQDPATKKKYADYLAEQVVKIKPLDVAKLYYKDAFSPDLNEIL
jgi:hypothetical protein